ncbi:MAG TPA: type II secretion system F family protein [Rhizomicrobium sp.]|nr:type II secretion system F family protein [Rhizomicrobium sp.]
MLLIVILMLSVAVGGAIFAFSGGDRVSTKRVTAIAKPEARVKAVDGGAKRKNVQNLLKEIESKNAEKQKKINMRQRLLLAGLPNVSVRNYYIFCGVMGVVTAVLCLITGQSIIVLALASLSVAIGMPRWVLSFMRKRREKAFTEEFANAIDVIVRSVKSGLPTNEAMRIVAREVPNPVGSEFNTLCEGLRLGVTLEQGVKKMYESMPTPEVAFFGIVMTIQQKSGGNLSEALGNLSVVLRDRKRLIGKIKAMSSEAKASAGIIGALPPAVAFLVYLTTPDYIMMLFNERMGNIMLVGCAFWMSLGIMVMRKMINFQS